jgi:Predicted dehydrogenases and related proteins
MNQGVHTVDLLLWLFGPVRRVFGKTIAGLHAIEVEDTAVAVLEFANGALGTLEAATSAYPWILSPDRAHRFERDAQARRRRSRRCRSEGCTRGRAASAHRTSHRERRVAGGFGSVRARARARGLPASRCESHAPAAMERARGRAWRSSKPSITQRGPISR